MKAIFHRNLNCSRLSTSSVFVSYPSSLLVHTLTSSCSLPGLIRRVHMPFLPSLQLCFTTRRMNVHCVRLRFQSLQPFILPLPFMSRRTRRLSFVCPFAVPTSLHHPIPFNNTTNDCLSCSYVLYQSLCSFPSTTRRTRLPKSEITT